MVPILGPSSASCGNYSEDCALVSPACFLAPFGKTLEPREEASARIPLIIAGPGMPKAALLMGHLCGALRALRCLREKRVLSLYSLGMCKYICVYASTYVHISRNRVVERILGRERSRCRCVFAYCSCMFADVSI